MKEEVFTVGDETNHGRILSFEIINNDMYVNCTRGKFNLREIEKTKQPLFTTKDGKDIYEGDKFYGVWKSDFRITEATAYNMRFWDENALRFSTEQAAKDWIVNNKPIISLNDVKKIQDKCKFQNREDREDEDYYVAYTSLVEDLLKQLVAQKTSNGNNR
jgi:hypothetical protein